MSNIDWGRPLEAYHEDGRVMEITCVHKWGNEQWPWCGVADQEHIFMGRLGVSRSSYGDMPGWTLRNKAEPKADIPEWAIKLTAKLSGYGDGLDGLSIPELMKFGSDMQMAFAKYIAEHGKDPDNEEALCVVRAMRDDDFSIGSMADGLCVEAALRGIKRGRELERGEVK